MLLVIDVGNTHSVFGVYAGETLCRRLRIRTERGMTADEYSLWLERLAQVAAARGRVIDATMVCSVVPPLTAPLSHAVQATLGHEPRIVGAQQDCGVTIRTARPEEVGADRIVNTIAAHALTGAGAIVVDFGTATTFDCIDASGGFVGGAIAPGLEISASALFTATAKLPRVGIEAPPQALGQDTVDALRSGLVFGYVGLVDGLVTRLRRELGGDPPVIATGGWAHLMATHCCSVTQVESDLTLMGLRLLHARMESPQHEHRVTGLDRNPSIENCGKDP
ncbi:MAG: type III pantothenate kinase [Polyangiales bacterium]